MEDTGEKSSNGSDERSEASFASRFKVDLVTSTKRIRSINNVLTKMNEHGTTVGPMSLLYRCVTDRLKVKVWTRSACRVRGFCIGFLVAFDKHWNMAMVDVHETYLNPLHRLVRPAPTGPGENFPSKKNNPRKSRKNATDPGDDQQDYDSCWSQYQSTSGIGRQTNSKGEKEVEKFLERHVPQLLLRGDNVVSVAILGS